MTNNHRVDNAFYLLFRKLISIETFKNTIRPKENYKIITRIISTENLSAFAGLDIEKLESDLLCDWSALECDITRINTALLFLHRIPYNEYHSSLALKISETLQNCGYSKEKETALNELKSFINKHIPTSLKGNELVETLYNRPDYRILLSNLPYEISFQAIFYENEENNYDSKVAELASLICQGKISHPAFAFYFFKELISYRVTILNYWAANDKALELDIYGPDLMLGTCPHLDVDDIYEKEKSSEVTENNKIQFKPTDKQ